LSTKAFGAGQLCCANAFADVNSSAAAAAASAFFARIRISLWLDVRKRCTIDKGE
jgi:hypothetical protein